jgi:hypothetical protein
VISSISVSVNDSLLSDESELMLILAFFAVARREDGERVRMPVKLFSPFLIVAIGRGFDDRAEDICINALDAASSSFPKLTTSSCSLLMMSDSNTFCFVGMMSFVDYD